MSQRTSFLSRLIGLYCILVALPLTSHKQTTIEAAAALLHNASLMLVLGVITLAVGLAMVLGHNVWSGGGLAITVTVIGWLTLIKGYSSSFCRPIWNRAFS